MFSADVGEAAYPLRPEQVDTEFADRVVAIASGLDHALDPRFAEGLQRAWDRPLPPISIDVEALKRFRA